MATEENATIEAHDKLIERGLSVITPTYAPKVILTRGEGPWVWDSAGRKYLDFLAGIAVNILGHCHPVFVERVQQQLATLLQTSNVFFNEPEIALAEVLVERTFADRVFFANSGAEAVEAALKLARRYQRKVREADRYEFVAMNNSFHGRTFGAMTATGQPKKWDGFEPLVPGFVFADFNDLDSVAACITDKTAAVLLEPVQGEGGVVPATSAFLEGVRQLCDDNGVLMILDEIQTGMGRTGALFAHQHYNVEPDIMSVAKGLGGGLPIGAMLCREEVAHGFELGSHATTFGGNPVCTAAGLAVFEVLDSENLIERVQVLGERLRTGLNDLAGRFPRILEVRGMGLMLGAECEGDLGAVVAASRDAGLLHNYAGNALRFVPPFVLSDGEVDEGLNRLETALGRTA